MPNSIKYSTSSESNSLTSGNFHLGVGDVDKGPTSTTGYYNGINPPSGGYTIYLNKASDGPSIYTPANDTELISLTNSIGAQSFTTAAQCKEWFVGQNDKMLVNREYENIVTDGLVFMVDAGFTPSYPGSGTSLKDLVGSRNLSLTNGPTFNSDNGGTISFDGTNDYLIINDSSIKNYTDITAEIWINVKEHDYWKTYFSYAAHEGTLQYGWGIRLGNQSNLGRLQYWGGLNNDSMIVYENGVEKASTSIGYILSPTAVNHIDTWKMFTLVVEGIASFNTGNNLTVATRSDSLNTATEMEMGNFKIYNRALSSTEVLQNYNAQKGRFGIT